MRIPICAAWLVVPILLWAPLRLSAQVTAPVMTGTFSDGGPVEGVSFRTETQSGTTDAAGTFTYIEGEVITFFIGDTSIGSVVASSALSSLDLVPGAPLYTTAPEATNALLGGPNTPETRAFNRLINVSVFFQTLDADANPLNGISIPNGVAALLTGVQIDFDLGFNQAFPASLDLRRMLNQAAAMGLLSTASIIKPGPALDAFYAGQGISYSFIRLLGLSDDTDGDGTADANVVTFTYNSAGYLTGTITDADADGIPDFAVTTTYDANGNPTTVTTDSNGDGAGEFIVSNTYDTNGNLVTASTDSDGDGSPDFIVTTTYDADGNVASVATDSNGDDAPDFIETTAYDADGNVTSVVTDSNGDGEADFIVTTAYDANGNVTSLATDSNGDGTPDFIVTTSYDAEGNVTSIATDANGDNTPDNIRTFTYDRAGSWTWLLENGG